MSGPLELEYLRSFLLAQLCFTLASMWWILFTAIDLYIGLIVIDVMAKSGSVPPEKLPRLQIVKKITIGAIAVLGAIFLAKIGMRYK